MPTTKRPRFRHENCAGKLREVAFRGELAKYKYPGTIVDDQSLVLANAYSSSRIKEDIVRQGETASWPYTKVCGAILVQLVVSDKILEKVVSPWLEGSENFILEEDGDSDHGIGRWKNIVTTWEEKYGLKFISRFSRPLAN